MSNEITLKEDLLKTYAFAYNNIRLIEGIIQHSINIQFNSKFNLTEKEELFILKSDLMLLLNKINDKVKDNLLLKYDKISIDDESDLDKLFIAAPLLFLNKKDKTKIFIIEKFLFETFIPNIVPDANISGLSNEISNTIKNMYFRLKHDKIGSIDDQGGKLLTDIDKIDLQNSLLREDYVKQFQYFNKDLKYSVEQIINNFIPSCQNTLGLVKNHFRSNDLSYKDKQQIIKIYLKEVNGIKKLIQKNSELSIVNIIRIISYNINSIYDSLSKKSISDVAIFDYISNEHDELNKIKILASSQLSKMTSDIGVLLKEITKIENDLAIFFKINEFMESLNDVKTDSLKGNTTIDNNNKILNYLQINTNNLPIQNIINTSEKRDTFENLFADILLKEFNNNEIYDVVDLSVYKTQEEYEKEYNHRNIIKEKLKIDFKDEIDKIYKLMKEKDNQNSEIFYIDIFNDIISTYSNKDLDIILKDLYDANEDNKNWVMFLCVFESILTKENNFIIKNILRNDK